MLLILIVINIYAMIRKYGLNVKRLVAESERNNKGISWPLVLSIFTEAEKKKQREDGGKDEGAAFQEKDNKNLD